MAESVRELFKRYFDAIAKLDIDALESMTHPDFVESYPQSGERFVGFKARQQMLEAYPGGLRADDVPPDFARIFGAEERWAITPGYTVLPLAGPERYTVVARTKYPDGSWWSVISIIELREGKVFRAETYFAPDFEAPEWRKGISEVVPRD